MKSILLISCPDKEGLVYAVTEIILKVGGNIVNLEQHVDPEERQFFMRVEWVKRPEEDFPTAFSKVAKKFRMIWKYYQSEKKLKLSVFVSKLDHCLVDILIRVESGQLPVEVPAIISNHPDMKSTADRYGVPYFCFPIDKSNKQVQEQKILTLLRDREIDFIALARYMRIVGKEILSAFANSIINVHHSFLPAFVGAKPYHKAYERGVKIIGATSHFATVNLDEGPIIEQSIRRVGHHYTVPGLVELGREIEKEVFFEAIRKYIERKIIVFKDRTIIFN